MPYVVNGIGTWNHGQRNTVSVPDFCEFCNRFGFLTSYDTRTYFVVLFLPVIPLGRKRILNRCPACQKWKEMPLAKWESLAKEVREKARHAIEQRLNEADTVSGALVELLHIQDRATFEWAAEQAERAHAGNAKVLHVLARGHSYFGDLAEAERCYLASLTLENADEAREGLAFVYLQQKRAAEAAPYLRHVLEKRIAEKSGLLYLLAEGLQLDGNHDTAYALVEKSIQEFPELAKDKAWAKLRKSTTKHRGSTKPLKRGSLTLKGKPARDRSPVVAVAGSMILVVLLGIGYLLLSFVEGRTREVHLVNGLDRAYTVTIDGEGYYLPPNETTVGSFSEGTHSVHAQELGLPEESIEIHTNFFTRVFNNEVVVINPDRVALLVWEETEYMEHVDESARYDYVFHTNEAVYVFSDIDYVFKEFPEEVQLSSSRTMKSRVSEAEMTPEEFGAMYEELEEAEFLENAARRFHYSPNNLHYLSLIGQTMEGEAAIAEMQAELAKRPVLLEVHRVYQDLVGGVRPTHDVEGEYAALLATDPENPDLIYLAGRATRDREAMLAKFREAADAGHAHSYAAIAFGHLTVGEFSEAKAAIEQALAVKADHPTFTFARDSIRLALGEYDAYLVSIPQNRAGIPEDYTGLQTMAMWMGVRGDTAQAVEELVNKSLKSWEREAGPVGADDRKLITDGMMSWRRYGKGGEEYLAELETSQDPMDAWVLALIRGESEAAAGAAEDYAWAPEEYAVLYVLLAEDGSAQAAEYLTKTTEMLAAAQDWETRLVGAVLSGATPADPAELLTLGILPASKRVLLAALAERFPDDRDAYLSMARTLNYDRNYPYHILDAYLTRRGK